MLSRIENVREQLHMLINQDASYEKIYTKSIELDVLIVEYYNFNDLIVYN